ncbi:unnamed protein product, partial [Vitis vinifera]
MFYTYLQLFCIFYFFLLIDILVKAGCQKKLDVYIDVPDIIDISHMRSRGIQPGEELLPEAVDEGKVESEKLLANEEIVAQLVSMGFNHLHCQKAAINTSNAGVEEAIIGCYHTWMIQI